MDSPTMLWSKKTKKDYHELLNKVHWDTATDKKSND